MCAASQESARDRVRYLLCGIPTQARKRRYIAVLKYYIDDSGSDPKPNGMFVLFGYLMEEARWEDFAEQWDTQLKNPKFFPIPYCRMSDAEAREGPFRNMDEPFRRAKVKDLAKVIHGCHPTAIGCTMRWSKYEAIVKGKVDPRLDNPYAILFFQVMRAAADLQIEFVNRIPDEVKRQVEREQGVVIAVKPVDFIFDDQGPAGNQCLGWWGGLKSRVQDPPHSIVVSNSPQFKDDREIAPLQAADMLAWHVRREYEYPNEDREEIRSLLNPAGAWEREISDSQLHQVVSLFNSGTIDPKSI
jgi:hypothetical protein